MQKQKEHIEGRVAIHEGPLPFEFDPNDPVLLEKLALANKIGTGKIVKETESCNRLIKIREKRKVFQKKIQEAQRKKASRKGGASESRNGGATEHVVRRDGKWFRVEGDADAVAKGHIPNQNRGGKSVFSKGSGKNDKR